MNVMSNELLVGWRRETRKFGWFPRHVGGRGDGNNRPDSRPKTRENRTVSVAMKCYEACVFTITCFFISNLVIW